MMHDGKSGSLLSKRKKRTSEGDNRRGTNAAMKLNKDKVISSIGRLDGDEERNHLVACTLTT